MAKAKLKIGAVGEIVFTVTEQHVIDFADNQMPAVLCTPWLIWFLEHAARKAEQLILRNPACEPTTNNGTKI